jgi:hypothetical protein
MEHRSTYDGDEPLSPKQLLSTDTRVSTLAPLACNPHLERSLVTGLLDHLHPAEVQWRSPPVSARELLSHDPMRVGRVFGADENVHLPPTRN